MFLFSPFVFPSHGYSQAVKSISGEPSDFLNYAEDQRQYIYFKINNDSIMFIM